ncbi:hypothetical protein EON65_11620 [archaeon]|nr:MAG: hypothetical protein EON65_11620 [archaeon]
MKKTKKSEVTEIKYSPSGEVVAIGSKDSLIHLLSVSGGYKHIGACRGHTSHVRSVDFSENGKYLRSCDASKELLHWDVESGQRLNQSIVYRNLTWKTQSCVYGWGLQGIHNKIDTSGKGQQVAPDTDISCVCRHGKLVVAASSIQHSALKCFDYPVLSNAVPTQYGGHSSSVQDVLFIDTSKGVRLVSAGGVDSCLCLWDLDS